MTIMAFGIPRFGANQQGQPIQKSPPETIGELNTRMQQLGISDDDVVNIQVDDEFYHVFYKKN